MTGAAGSTAAVVTGATSLVAVDALSRSLAEVEHLVHELDEALGPVADLLVSTHLVPTPASHFTAVASWTGGDRATAVGQVMERIVERVGGLEVLASGEDVVLLGRDPRVTDVLGAAVAEHVHRQSGRLARYPGQSEIERRLSVQEVLDSSTIDAVEGLAGVEVRPDSVVDLTGFARPTWRGGRCVLLVQPGLGGLVPFELRDQIPCCSDH